jgi:hypothetical protein
VYNAAGEVFRTESELLENVDTIRYQLQERDTRYGGVAKVVLVLTALDGAEVTKEVFCPPAQLQLLGAQYGANKYSYTELEQKTLDAADDAANAAEIARIASNVSKESASIASQAAGDAFEIYNAYKNGELKGDKGDTGVQGPQGDKGDKGDKGEKGENGKDYILTEEDKSEIATLIPTHEKYFDIDENGLISLKDVYRGASRPKDVTPSVLLTPFDASLSTTALEFSQSDNKWGNVGSKYYELPQEIRIPTTVNGITVTGFKNAAFF